MLKSRKLISIAIKKGRIKERTLLHHSKRFLIVSIISSLIVWFPDILPLKDFKIDFGCNGVNLWSDLPLKRTCFRVSEKGCTFLDLPNLMPVLLIFLSKYSSQVPTWRAQVPPLWARSQPGNLSLPTPLTIHFLYLNYFQKKKNAIDLKW